MKKINSKPEYYRYLLLFVLIWGKGYAQPLKYNSVRDERNPVYAFTQATIHVDYETTLHNATLLVEKDRILSFGNSVAIPKEAIVINCTGKHIFPSFIEMYGSYGMPEVKHGQRGGTPQYESSRKGAFYWNDAIKPDVSASLLFNYNEQAAAELRNYGFGMVNTHQKDGIIRGSSTVALLGSDKENKQIIKEKAALHFSFNKGVSQQEYPSSQTGAIALIRQFMYDAEAYNNAKEKNEINLSLQSFNELKNLPFIMETTDKQEIFRAASIAKEFNTSFIYKGSGTEYQRLQELAEIKARLIIPVVFPQAMDVSNPYDADMVSLADLKHWELAPSNAAFLQKQGIEFAITADGCKSSKEFFDNLYKVVHRGLSKQALLKALTYTPAKMLGIDNKAGCLKKNFLANFIITEGEPGDKEFKIYEHWIAGKQYVNDFQAFLADLRGNYRISAKDVQFIDGKKLTITGKKNQYKATLHITDSTKLIIDLKQEKTTVNGNMYSRALGGFVRFNFQYDTSGIWNGWMIHPNGKIFPVSVEKTHPFEEKIEENNDDDTILPGPILLPLRAYGFLQEELNGLSNKSYLIKNATVWTCEKEGILEQTDILLENGKISKVGKGISAGKETIIIQGTGLHVTPGIIDEHSHIALSKGVNEAAESSTAEVRMADVVNADDINIYRQLAGGVTTAQLLHGSANAIGGQSAIIKLKWGRTAPEMLFPNAPGFIKFALGENVKQSNWGDNYSIRYPQTRMGVEQFYYDMFYRAREYGKNKDKNKRKDLELEALWEILNNKRFITCHSYVQSEINMLMKVADSLGFTVNTFTHILEGYKVADKMKIHGANASTFADWWAYKMEVMEAIPHNAALLTRMGVNTSVNSDDAEMARRLNQEAAKAIKYGNLSREEALKLVTLNPAKMLHIDHRVGSIKPGKDADVVIWSADPLSIYAKVLYTFIDGELYFSRERNNELTERDNKEKNRLIQAMLKAKNDGEPTIPVMRKEYWLYDCEDIHVDEVELLQIEP
ncbi:MAG: amidohydrolase family protein [Flavobacteriales bacterium]|nr:amidohydrolase family protein [Flavobacteriales bacterium]